MAILASKIEIGDVNFRVHKIHISELVGNSYGESVANQVEEAVNAIMSRVITMKVDGGW